MSFRCPLALVPLPSPGVPAASWVSAAVEAAEVGPRGSSGEPGDRIVDPKTLFVEIVEDVRAGGVVDFAASSFEGCVSGVEQAPEALDAERSVGVEQRELLVGCQPVDERLGRSLELVLQVMGSRTL